MWEYISGIIGAAFVKRSWFNPSAASKRWLNILIANKYPKLIMTTGTLYDNREVYIKLDGVERENIGLAYIYALNISTGRRHSWYILMDAPPKYCEWIIEEIFNKTEQLKDKFHDCRSEITGLERGIWKILLNTLRDNDNFI